MIWFGHPALAYTIYAPAALIGLSLPYVVAATAAGELGAGASPRSPATRLARRQTSRLRVSTQVTQLPTWARPSCRISCFHPTRRLSPAICLALHRTSQLGVNIQSGRHGGSSSIQCMSVSLRPAAVELAGRRGNQRSQSVFCCSLLGHSDSVQDITHSVSGSAACATTSNDHRSHANQLLAVQAGLGILQNPQQFQQPVGTFVALTVLCCIEPLRTTDPFRHDRASCPFEKSGNTMHTSSATPDGHPAQFRSWDTPW